MSEGNPIPRLNRWPGRSNRREFWLSVLGLACIEAVFAVVLHIPTIGQLVGFGVWLYVSARRLHDINASAMWGWSVFLLGFALGFTKAIAAPFLHSALIERATNPILALATVGLVLIIGSIPGTDGDNRFGSRTAAKWPAVPVKVADIFD